MNRLFKKSVGNYAYYNYLTKYEPQFLVRYQSNDHYKMGRKSNWKNLVFKYAGDHVSLEEEHNGRYKTHMVFVNFSYRFAFFLFAYMVFYWSFFLGEQGKAFRTSDWDHLFNPPSDLDYPTRYESLYLVTKPRKY